MKKNIFGILTLCLCLTGCILNKKTEITDINFEFESISIKVGEVKKVGFTVLPQERVIDSDVKYFFSTEKNTCLINSTTSSGLVLTGVEPGSNVLIAECEGHTCYMEVDVYSDETSFSPYISVDNVAYEIEIGKRKTFEVTLFGGEPSDKALFMYSNSDDNVCSITTADNAVIVEALGPGYSQIEISHPKAKYSAKVMIYVAKERENNVFITTSKNVMKLSKDGGTEHLSVSLENSKVNNKSLFSFNFNDEQSGNIVDIISNNNVCSITPKKEGVAELVITHPEAVIPLYVQIVVVNEGVKNYINSDDIFVVMGVDDNKTVRCFIEGNENIDAKFTYEIEDDSICSVSQINDYFYITGKKIGKTKLFIKSDNAENVHEIYVIIESNAEKLYYLTTMQNVIQTEEGADDIMLYVYLPDGNEGDRNSFRWEVSDSSIINVESAFGNVSYSRAIYNVYEDLYEATCVIKPLKAGIADIKVTHPKSNIECNVKVYVYPEGTYSSLPCVLNGDGIVKVVKGTIEPHELTVSQGEITGELIWSVVDNSIAEVSGNGLHGNYTGKGSGVTVSKVESECLSYPYECTVVSGSLEEINSYRALYVSNNYINLSEGNNGYYEIKYTGIVDDENFVCSVNDVNVCSAFMSQNVLVVKGLHKGNTEITVSNSDCLNKVVLFVNVIGEETIEYPYYFTNEKFVGIVNGKYKDIKVNLVGASEIERNKISWMSNDSDIININGSGDTVRVTAMKTGEAVLYAHSDKCENDAKIVVYTADTEAELEKRVLLQCDKTNYLSYIGNDLFCEVSVNDPEKNRENIRWTVDDISVLKIDSNYESAYIRCIGEGNAVVTVSCGDALPLNIYVSVKKTEEEAGVKEIILPDVIELTEGLSKTIEAGLYNLNDKEKTEIIWMSEDENICEVTGNGGSLYVKAVREGVTYIKCSNKGIGYEKKITFVCYGKDSIKKPVLALERSYYDLKCNEYLNLHVSYGSISPSDELKSGIEWIYEGDLFELYSNGEYCSIYGKKEGYDKVRIRGDGFLNEIEFTVCVSERGMTVNYGYFCSPAMKGILTGDVDEYSALIKDSEGNYIVNYQNLEYEIEDEENCAEISVAENAFRIKGLKKGECYLILRHPEVKYSYRVLIYIADTLEELNSYFPITTTKDHYLINIGESAVLKLETKDDSENSKIKWSCSDTTLCSYQISSNKKNLTIRAKKSGIVKFTATHEDSPVDVVFTVSINEYSNYINNVNIVTESIIGLYVGQSYTTAIETSLTGEDISKLTWSVKDSDIIEISGNGLSCDITALKEGCTELTVKYTSSIYRTLVVYVQEDLNKVNEYHAMNIDRRYNVIKCGSSISLYNFYGRKVADKSKTVFTDVYDNNVVDCSYENNILVVTGKNEGIAKIHVENPETNSFDIFIEVKEYEVNTGNNVISGYLSSFKTLYQMDINNPMIPVEFDIVPVGIDESCYSSIKYTLSDENVCSISYSNLHFVVYPDKLGSTFLRISSVYSSNELVIKLVVSDSIFDNLPYIYTENNVVELKSGESADLDFSIKNLDGYDNTKFSYSLKDEICSVENLGSKLRIKGLESGQTVLNISYPGLESINIVVSVRGVAGDLIYLTTGNNYKVIQTGTSSTLSVKLVGFEEVNQNNFIWTIEEGNDVISLNGTGPTVVANGLKEGFAKIKVVHQNSENTRYSALYPLYITVKVVDDINSEIVYINTESNVITVKQGKKTTFNVDLVNGNSSQYSYFQWEVPSAYASIIRCVGSGNSCVVQGLQEGIGRVTVSHPDCIGMNSIDIIIIVEENTDDESLYITTDSTLVEDKLSNIYKTVNVSLNGGTAAQQLLFSWEILTYESVIRNSDGTSRPVVSLVSETGNTNVIKYVNEGTAIVRVKNSATSYYLDIKFVISESTKLSFSSSSVTVKEGETVSISMTCPTGKTVIYESENEEILQCYGTSKICVVEGISTGGKNSVTAVIRARTTDGSCSDELIVKVLKSEEIVNYISCTSPVIVMRESDEGMYVSASLCGSNVAENDSESIRWNISSNTNNVIKFVSVDSLETTGSRIMIRPVKDGTEQIIISHPKSKNNKILYVTVEKNDVSLRISDVYLICEKENVYTLTASLEGITASEVDNIVWTNGDSTVLQFINPENSVTQTGSTLNFKTKELSNDGVIITCSYGSLIKTCTVFVQELPRLNISVSKDVIRTDQTKYYQIICTPSSYLEKLNCNWDSNMFVKMYDNSGNRLTKLVTKESEIENDEVPADIHVPYLKVTGGVNSGNTVFTLSMESLSASLNIVTDNNVHLLFEKYCIYDKNGKQGEYVSNPTVINASRNDTKVRVYYKTEPEELNINEIRSSGFEIGGIDMQQDTVFDGKQEKFVRIVGGENSDGKYFDLIPQGKANYGRINFHEDRDLEKTVAYLPVAFVMTDFENKFYLDGKFTGMEQYVNKCHWDRYNYIARLVGNQEKKACLEMTVEGLSDIYNYKIAPNSKMKYVGTNAASTVNGSFRYSQFVNCSTVEILYPMAYGYDGKVTKTITLFNDIYN